MSPNGSYAITFYPDNLAVQRPRQKMTRFLRFLPNQDRKQAIKKGFKAFHKISFESEDPYRTLSPSEIRRVTASLKRLRHTKTLPRLEIDLQTFRYNDKIVKFFQSLKHTKCFSEIHFIEHVYWHSYSEELTLYISRALGYIRAWPKLKIRLSLPVSGPRLNEDYENLRKMVTSFTKHRSFTSAHFSFLDNCELSKRQEIISILKHSKSLSDLSLNLRRDLGSETLWQELRRGMFSGNPDPRLHDVFRTLKRIKTVKNCRLCFQSCKMENPELQDLEKALNKAAKSFNLEVIIDDSQRRPIITIFEWWLFRRSLRSIRPHKVSAKHVGRLRPFSQEHITCYMAIATVIAVIFIILFVKE